MRIFCYSAKFDTGTCRANIIEVDQIGTVEMLGQGKAINRRWHFEDATPNTRIGFEVHSNRSDRWSINRQLILN